MPRTADYTIKGFLYQFNKTLLEILNSHDGSVITVEGIVEDVEIVTPSITTAIQCKYHEASEAFSFSQIFKPLLQMMHHFHTTPDPNINYILFAHYASVRDQDQPQVEKSVLQSAIDSTNKDLQKYSANLRNQFDLDGFLSKFKMEFGPALETLVLQVSDSLVANGISREDIEILAYPNAITMIADISANHDLEKRKITKQKFVECLKSIRKTAISRWTMALRTRKQLLAAKRKQLKSHLDKNSRLRYFVIDSKSLDDYDAEIVLFVSDYLDKYHFKQAHINTPLVCLSTTEKEFQDIQYRLHTKGISSTDGYIGQHFEESLFFRDPLSQKGTGGTMKREFSVRLIRWEDHCVVLNNRKCDDLFIFGTFDYSSLDTIDINVEHLAATSFKEIKYVMGVSNVYE